MAIRDKQPDADAGRVIVDDDLESLEKRIALSYGEAAKDITTDLDAFLAKYETKDDKKREQVASGEITEKEYIDWRNRQIFRSDAMKAKIEDLSMRMVNADKQAMAMVNNELPEIYATSYNFGGFRGETYAQAAGFDYTQFTIINEDAVKTLMKEDPDLIPWKPSVNGTEDKAWNRKHIQNAIQQGIVRGEGMDKISRRLLPVVNMDQTAAIRTARTAVNGVENKGRTDATQRVVDAGVPMVQQWSCTHDDRTRYTHILVDGETIAVGGTFSNGLKYPADPSGDPAEVYNCRCSAISVLEGIDHSNDDELYEKMMSEEYYDDWMKVKEDREAKEAQFQKGKLKAEDQREQIEKKWAENKQKRIEADNNRDIIPKESIENPKDFIAEKDDNLSGMKQKAEEIQRMSKDEIRDEFIDNPDSYVYNEAYQKRVDERKELLNEQRAIGEEQERLNEELKKEETILPESEWTEEDKTYFLIMGEKPTDYTERGEEINERLKELSRENRDIESKLSTIRDRLKSDDNFNYLMQSNDWERTKDNGFVAGDINKDYQGFSTKMDIVEFDKDLSEGKGFIAEMSPDEYLDRIAYEIFHTTRERAIICDYDNVKEYVKMMADGVKFDMGYLDYTDRGQEGRHRAMAAKLLGIDKIPVYIRGRRL